MHFKQFDLMFRMLQHTFSRASLIFWKNYLRWLYIVFFGARGIGANCAWLLLKCAAVGIGFHGAETNCGIAHILGILLMNSYNTDIFFSTYYNLQSVHFQFKNNLYFDDVTKIKGF